MLIIICELWASPLHKISYWCKAQPKGKVFPAKRMGGHVATTAAGGL